MKKAKQGIPQEIIKGCQQPASTVNNYEHPAQQNHGILQDFSETCQHSESTLHDSEQATQGRHRAPQNLIENCEQSATSPDKQEEFPKLHLDIDNDGHMAGDQEMTDIEIVFRDILQDTTRQCHQSSITVHDSEYATQGKDIFPQERREEFKHSANIVGDSENMKESKHGIPHDTTKECQQSVNIVNSSGNDTQDEHGVLQDLSEESQNSASTANDSEHATQGKHRTLVKIQQNTTGQRLQPSIAVYYFEPAPHGSHRIPENFAENCQQSESASDKQNDLPDDHVHVDSAGHIDDHEINTESKLHEMDNRTESSSSEEELDDDMDEDEEEGDSDPQVRTNETSFDKRKMNRETYRDNRQGIDPQIKQTKQLPLETDEEGTMPDKTDSTEIDDQYQNITIQPTLNTNGMRSWDKKYFCLFCDKGFVKLPQHLKSQHKMSLR